jgi:hypothetical protein
MVVAMNQKSLFDTSPEPVAINHYGYPIARKSDPEPSQVAASNAEAKLGGYHKIFMLALKRINREATAQEVAAEAVPIDGTLPVQAAFSKRESVRKRAKELVTLGLIRAVDSRICRVTGNESTVYEVCRG